MELLYNADDLILMAESEELLMEKKARVRCAWTDSSGCIIWD